MLCSQTCVSGHHAHAARHPDAAVGDFLASALPTGPQHPHLSLRAIAGCNKTAFGMVPRPMPMCKESFVAAAPGEGRTALGARASWELPAERFLLQCAAHANEEYLVRYAGHVNASVRSCDQIAGLCVIISKILKLLL